MKNERIAEIKANLNGLGTEATTLYTNQEIVDKLVNKMVLLQLTEKQRRARQEKIEF